MKKVEERDLACLWMHDEMLDVFLSWISKKEQFTSVVISSGEKPRNIEIHNLFENRSFKTSSRAHAAGSEGVHANTFSSAATAKISS